MANSSAAPEPSMEEILASIRQIISDDGEASPADPDNKAMPHREKSPDMQSSNSSAEPGDAGGPSASTNLEAVETPASEALRKSAPQPGRPASAKPPAAEALVPPTLAPHRGSSRPPLTAPRAARRNDDGNLLSADSDAAVSGAFSALAHTILAQNARTLEDLVAEMLRPMLREWLDENLPSLVERLVKEEIERVSRGRR
ncbi:MAG TPA: DUF2497 domain-containing protein [Afifellaceae bacterium]|nr:DUF2497 domain-containing protein [Afifellaceae bacterium]